MKSILILDLGSQYTHLIAARARELGYRSTTISIQELPSIELSSFRALIISGGPRSIYEDPQQYGFLFQNPAFPILGICYGAQIMAHHLGGEVTRGAIGEYGSAQIHWPANNRVWMSHTDTITRMPMNFRVLATSDNGMIAAIQHLKNPWVGYQFHPEVTHSDCGAEYLQYFFTDVAHLSTDTSARALVDDCINDIREKLHAFSKPASILCAFSGGVDSLVAASLAARALRPEDRLQCFFVDHGLLRPQDLVHIETLKVETGLSVETIHAREVFAKRLKGTIDPEDKRKIIGHTFIEVFQQLKGDHTHLLQGTLFPDVIESMSPEGTEGPSVTIKSHHNVGGLPAQLNLELLEPLRLLFKDDVRRVGSALGLKKDWLLRHPFPGPGLGIRILGELTSDAIRAVQLSDQILFETLQKHRLYDGVWQAFTVFLPIRTVGIKGDARAYENVICLRMVNSFDGMTADWTELPKPFLSEVSSRITNEIQGITRVVYDVTSKPPGTIEWE